MLDVFASDDAIKAQAIHAAGRARSLVKSIGCTERAPTTPQGLMLSLHRLASEMQGKAPGGRVTLAGTIARMYDPLWWRRTMRRELSRGAEAVEHGAGKVRRSRECYVSDHNIRTKRARRKAGREILTGLEVQNEAGQAFNLQEVADSSVSNPKHRRAELMLRCRGFEECAQFMGHVAVFLTITCPSRFHKFTPSGGDNPRWDGSTPKDAQKYLTGIWAKMRAAWHRRGWAPYGFRVAEPHHDGCPHWHVLLFVDAQAVGTVVTLARAYALKDSPGERGALQHRFTVEHIDASKGSATGYIAKYIAKNIDGLRQDGEAVGLDFASGKNATVAAERVLTWASTWNIRQFQQIGGPSVTVWRELRKVRDVQQLELFEKPRAAADRGDWFGFWMLQGGPDVKRKELTAKPVYAMSETPGRYGDSVERITGVSVATEGGALFMQTRLHEWTVQRAGLADVNAAMWDHRDAMERARNIARFLADAGMTPESFNDGFKREGEPAFSAHSAPRTCVNNCTPPTVFNFDTFGPYVPQPMQKHEPTPEELERLPWLIPATQDQINEELANADTEQHRADFAGASLPNRARPDAWNHPTAY